MAHGYALYIISSNILGQKKDSHSVPNIFFEVSVYLISMNLDTYVWKMSMSPRLLLLCCNVCLIF